MTGRRDRAIGSGPSRAAWTIAGIAALAAGWSTYAAYRRDIAAARSRVASGSLVAAHAHADRSNTRASAKVRRCWSCTARAAASTRASNWAGRSRFTAFA